MIYALWNEGEEWRCVILWFFLNYSALYLVSDLMFQVLVLDCHPTHYSHKKCMLECLARFLSSSHSPILVQSLNLQHLTFYFQASSEMPNLQSRSLRLFSIPMKSFSVLKIFFLKTCEYLGFSRLDSLNFLHWSKWSVSKFWTVKPSLCGALESEPLQIFTSFDNHFRE